MKERIEYFDNAKALLILLVVIGHELIYANPQYNILPYTLAQGFIYSFHMPLFPEVVMGTHQLVLYTIPASSSLWVAGTFVLIALVEAAVIYVTNTFCPFLIGKSKK